MYAFRDYIQKSMINFKQGEFSTVRNILQSYGMCVSLLGLKDEEMKNINELNQLTYEFQRKQLLGKSGNREWIKINTKLNHCFEVISKALNTFETDMVKPIYMEMVDRKKIRGCIATEVII